jgi:hypothetical protein
MEGFLTMPAAVSPALIWVAPIPREHAVPKMVAIMARMSMTRPDQPLAPRSPMSGIKAELRSWRRPSLKVE